MKRQTMTETTRTSHHVAHLRLIEGYCQVKYINVQGYRASPLVYINRPFTPTIFWWGIYPFFFDFFCQK
jgi:hypothetical protein